MDRYSLIVSVKSENIYGVIAKEVEKRFDTSNYELERPLLKGKAKNVIGLIKNAIDGKIMKEFLHLRAKTYSYLADGCDESRKEKDTKTVS